MLDVLEIDLEPFFDQKVNSWNIVLYINSEDENKSDLILKSHHLVMNPGQGPHSKCTPGHNSIKDANIIKSY